MLSAQIIVCLSVCLFYTRRYGTKTVKHRITQTTPYNSPGSLVFLYERSRQKFQRGHANGGAKYRWGRLKSAIFDHYAAISETVQDRDIYSYYRTLTELVCALANGAIFNDHRCPLTTANRPIIITSRHCTNRSSSVLAQRRLPSAYHTLCGKVIRVSPK